MYASQALGFRFTLQKLRSPVQAAFEHYLFAPLVLGLWAGITRAGTHHFPSPDGYIYYWLMTHIPAWWCYTLATWVLAFALRPLRLPFWSILLMGFFAGYFALWANLMPLRNMVSASWLGYAPAPFSYGNDVWPLAYVAVYLAVSSLPWVAFNLLHHFVFGVPKFGYGRHTSHLLSDPESRLDISPAPAQKAFPIVAQTAGTFDRHHEPALAHRIGLRAGAEIVALTAQEHYTLVQTTMGAKLVLMRLTDAIAEMKPVEGLRVHRSHWVALDYITGVERKNRSRELVLRNGQRVPISRSYAVAVNEALSASLAISGDKLEKAKM